MVNTKNKKSKNKKSTIKNTNQSNINDFTKKGVFKTLFSGASLFDYKFVMYWLPILLYVISITGIIIYSNYESEWIIAILSGITIFIIYFIIDIIYQTILCKNKKVYQLFYNSLLNALVPSIFVLIGYILAILLRDIKSQNINDVYNSNIQYKVHTLYSNEFNTSVILYNIHRNNVIVSVFFYIFSIIYNNPLNKKKCINNKLC